MFKKISVKAKVLTILSVSIILIGTINMVQVVLELNESTQKEMELFKKESIEAETAKIKGLVRQALTTMAYFNERSDLSLEQKKKQAYAAIEKLRYSPTGYFWINSYDYKVVAHGQKPSLVGRDLGNLQDKKGNYIYRDIVRAASSSERAGTVEYFWPKTKDGEALPKLAYVEEFRPWNVIIGTGIYIDDIDKKMAIKKEHAFEVVEETILILLVTMLVATIIIITAMYFVMNKLVVKPLKEVEDGLSNFFAFLNKETTKTIPLSLESEDEFGKMAESINENIDKTLLLIKEDEKLVENVKEVVADVNNGCITKKVQAHTSNKALEELRESFNMMLDTITGNVATDLRKVLAALEKYSNLDFTQKIDDKGHIAQALNSLSQTISDMLVENLKTGSVLINNAEALNQNVHTLSVSSNQAAANLEETAAALEEITGNMKSNQENVNKMSSYAKDVTTSVSTGQSLAVQTVESMDEINEQTNNIAEAITVIDQIAFQTNILSLNAAVEAATAGEAGKGFAVVAGEVRNLASRSAEAANEIKKIVENATLKANEGKAIATKMINGYETLNENIESTIRLIDRVAVSSNEQQVGVTQVNDALAQLDEMTQENANVATQARDIASQTNAIAQKIVEDTNKKEFLGKESYNL